MLSVIMQSVIMLSVIMLSVIMRSVVVPNGSERLLNCQKLLEHFKIACHIAEDTLNHLISRQIS